MDHSEYEALVRSLLGEFVVVSSRFSGCQVSGGGPNRISGASGFPHQIDVSVRLSPLLLLVECKYWADPIDAEPILVLASRLADIRANEPTTEVHASIVSQFAPTSGAQTLATYFGISIGTVLNPHEYAVRVFDHVFASIRETIGFTDDSSASAKRNGG